MTQRQKDLSTKVNDPVPDDERGIFHPEQIERVIEEANGLWQLALLLINVLLVPVHCIL